MVYLLVVLWLVLFKFSSDPLAVLSSYQTRSLNLIPFAGISSAHLNEAVYNFVVFIPLGLLLGVNLKKTEFGRKLAYICMLSFAIEIVQFVFAIGRTDITDVITNTLGGLLGLAVYEAGKKHSDNEKLDRSISIACLTLVIVFTLLRILALRVRYQTH